MKNRNIGVSLVLLFVCAIIITVGSINESKSKQAEGAISVVTETSAEVKSTTMEDKTAETSEEVKTTIAETDTKQDVVAGFESAFANVPTAENLTVDNNADLANLLQLKDPSDPSIKAFADKYNGSVIEFDGNISAMNPYISYNSATGVSTELKGYYDMLICPGEYNENTISGPQFRCDMVSIYDVCPNDIEHAPEVVKAGATIHITAMVGGYDDNTELFKLYPQAITLR